MYRRLREDSIEIYKSTHNIDRIDSETLLPAWKSEGLATRGHQLRLQKRYSKSKIHASFFSYRMVNIWNRLPEKVVLSSSVNCFKGRYHAFFGENCYETDLDRILSNAFSSKSDSLDEDKEENQDSVFDRFTGLQRLKMMMIFYVYFIVYFVCCTVMYDFQNK